MLQLHRIKIIGFKSATSEVDAQLSGSKVSIIFGDNGCGKTTFLKVLHAVLAQDESVLIQNNISNIHIEYVYEDRIQLVSLSRDDNDDYDWSEILSSPLGDSSSLSLGVERGVVTRGARIEPRYIHDFFRHPRRRAYLNHNVVSQSRLVEELSNFLRDTQRFSREERFDLDLNKKHLYLQNIKIENIEELLIEKYRLARVIATKRIQNALFDTLSVAISLDKTRSMDLSRIPQDFETQLYDNADRIIEALDDGEENPFKSTVIKILSNLNKDLNKIRGNPILCKLFINIIDELRYEKLILGSINLLVETFNSYLINDKELIVTTHDSYIRIGNNRHSLNELSSGERHILTFLSLVLFEGNNRDFVIIDEPEISLNIKWQRELIPLFEKLIPNTQIILASHSPSLSNNNLNYLCELKTSPSRYHREV